jgi:predicted nucleotidyltransferase
MIDDTGILGKSLYSLILFGSLVRGDFREGVSDIDFFAVVIDDSIIPTLKSILNECCKDLKIVEIDLAWEYFENISDPLKKGYPFKFLTIYLEDFILNHIVVYGKDIVDLIPRYELRVLVPWRCRIMLWHLDRNRDNPKMLHILAGETARFMGWLHVKSLHKNDILRALSDLGDKDALSIYVSYLDSRETKHPKDYLVSFITTRVSSIMRQYYTSKV